MRHDPQSFQSSPSELAGEASLPRCTRGDIPRATVYHSERNCATILLYRREIGTPLTKQAESSNVDAEGR